MASSSESLHASFRYDVFLSFRGKDVRKTFVDHLYHSLLQQGIHIYKDDQTLPRGESISPSLLKAIDESKISVIIFSKNYVNSSWCLDELVHIMKCRDARGQIVYPIFYDVNPSELREAVEMPENSTKAGSWNEALAAASKIAGWEPKYMANGHESVGIKEIVNTISDRLFSLMPDADEDLVGMGTRSHSLKSKLEIGAGDVRMVGIWGIGGSGKTTLAFSVYMEISRNFEGHCIVDNIREESSKCGLKSLQQKVLSEVLKTKVQVNSVEDGRHKIKNRLRGCKVLILLDDVDDRKQIEALAGSHKWFGEGSRIMITTRDEHLLKAHKVDVVSPVSLLSEDEAIRLFNKHAYDEDKPIEDYDKLSLHVVSYAAGLPLAIKVLGSFLFDKDKDEWVSPLARLKDIPEIEIVEKLKISYDALKPLEKELFLDIACFYRGSKVDWVMSMLDACGFYPGVGVKVLMQKALITISDGVFNMHDLVQEMGHYIVPGEHPNNAEKHSRVWKTEEIDNMCLGDVTTVKENDSIEALAYEGHSSRFPGLVSSMKKQRFLVWDVWECPLEAPTFLSNELRYIDISGLLPDDFHPTKLVVMKLGNNMQIELWKSYKLLPHLKELDLFNMIKLLSTPDFDGLPCLEKLTLNQCHYLEEIHPSLGYHTSLVHVTVDRCPTLRKFPSIVQMKKLHTLEIWSCIALRELPEIKANMDSLVNLILCGVGIEVLPSSIGKYCINLISIRVEECNDLKSIEGKFHALKHMRKFLFSGQTQIEKLPKDLFDENCCLEHLSLPQMKRAVLPFRFPRLPRFLKKLDFIDYHLEDAEIPYDIVELSNLQELDLSGNYFSRLDFSLSPLTCLKLLNLSDCTNLVELPELPSSIVILKAENCPSLEVVGDFHKNCKWLSQVLLINVKSVIGGDRLLHTMLQGELLENHSKSLIVDGLEIAKQFKPRMVSGRRCRLQLAENWYNDFSGFLICAAFDGRHHDGPKITMEHEMGGWSYTDSKHDDVEWEKIDKMRTWVGYVSFGALRHTAWWDQTFTAVLFSASQPDEALGVALVMKRKSPILTTDFHNCEQRFKIHHDSNHALHISFSVIKINPLFNGK